MEADAHAHRVVELRKLLADEADASKRKDLKDELEILTDRYHNLETLPTWPIAAPTRRRFAVNNAVFAIPLVAALLDGHGSNWSDVGSAIESWFSS